MPFPIPANLRALAKRPAFTLAAITIVALGIALATTVTSVVDALIFRPIPVENIDQIYRAHSSVYGGVTTPPDARDLFDRTQTKTFSYNHLFSVEFEMDPYSDLVVICQLQGKAFEVLGWKAEKGRLLMDADMEEGSEPTTVLSYDYWQTELRAKEDILGKLVRLNGKPFRVVGILPPEKDRVHRTIRPAFWIPLVHTFDSWVYTNRNWHSETVLTRLGPDDSPAAFQTQLDQVDEYLSSNYTDPTGNLDFHALPEMQAAFESNKDIVSQSYIILGLVAALLLITCFNVGNMLLSNAYRREREFAVRRSLGANPTQLLKQLLGESLFIATVGGVVGILLSIWLVSLADALPFTRWVEVYLNQNSILAATLATLFTGVASGLIPAYHLARGDAADSLKRGSKGSSVALSAKALVVAQITLSSALLTACLLYYEVMQEGLTFDSGYDAEKLAHFEASFQSIPNGSRQQAAENLRAKLSEIPGVTHVSFSTMRPLRGGGNTDVIALNSSFDNEGKQNLVESMFACEGFLATLGIPILEGRDLRRDEAGWPFKTAIVNQAMAKRYWPEQGAIGQEFHPWGTTENAPTRVVGVYKDFPSGPWRDIGPQFMLNQAQKRSIFFVRTEGNPQAIADSLEAIIRDPAADFVAREIRYLADAQRQALRNEKSALIVLGALAICALSLSSVGVWYTTRQFVRQSRKELSIRLAIGASPSSLLTLTLKRSMSLCLLGLLLGNGLSYATGIWIQSALPNESGSTYLPYITMTLLLGTIALIAAYVPARSALQADPRDALSEV